jgi:hypothetical protein
MDGELDVERPEILMYERLPDGTYHLTGVEYILLFRFWPQDSVPPKLMGVELLQDNERRYSYLHMWIWKPSTAGIFADWNPAVQCPSKPR